MADEGYELASTEFDDTPPFDSDESGDDEGDAEIDGEEDENEPAID